MEQVGEIAKSLATIIGLFGIVGIIRLSVAVIRFFDRLSDNVEKTTLAMHELTQQISRLVEQHSTK